MTRPDSPLRLAVVGAGGFGEFLTAAIAGLPSVRLAAISDLDIGRAQRLGATQGVPTTDWDGLLADADVHALAITTPPATHAALTIAALNAGKHVFCEKPLATTVVDATAVRSAVAATGRTLVVDHVLRYNPLLRLIGKLRADGTLGPVQRFSFENDAADEDLPAGHWFWDAAVSGGIFVEHGVHFFDAASALLGGPPLRVQAMGAVRPDGDAAGATDLAVATAAYPCGALATFAHGFSHPRRCERQLLRVDLGTAEARLSGWIPVSVALDMWTDDTGVTALRRLANERSDALALPGFRLTGDERITVRVATDAGPPAARGRGRDRVLPHHVSMDVDLGGAAAKQRVYAESVRAAVTDLARCAAGSGTPVADVDCGWASVATACAAEQSMHTATTVAIPMSET
jgi:predicted dehydrogenase